MSKIKHKYVGCSGFHYDDWKGNFYPDDVPKRDWLKYYADQFNTVELNNSFYRLPKKETIRKWYESTPENFVFALKGSRYVTHIKRLKDPKDSLKKMYEAAAVLEDKLGCILWQLPPNFKKNIKRLEEFCKASSKDFKHVIEFRHDSWFKKEVYDLLNKYDFVCCTISSAEDFPETIEQTSDTIYIRFHGKNPDAKYKYDYSGRELGAWKRKLHKVSAENVFAFFNNDYRANAVKNAKKLEQSISDI